MSQEHAAVACGNTVVKTQGLASEEASICCIQTITVGYLFGASRGGLWQFGRKGCFHAKTNLNDAALLLAGLAFEMWVFLH